MNAASIKQLSGRRVTKGGESGLWRWLIPALAIGVVMLGGQQVVVMNSDADASLDTASAAQELSGQMAEFAGVIAQESMPGRRGAPSIRRIKAARNVVSATIQDLPNGPQTQVVQAELGKADRGIAEMAASIKAGEIRSAAALGRRHAHPGAERATAVSRKVAQRFGDVSTQMVSRARNGVILLLTAGLVLATLLLWSFWARRNALVAVQHERRFKSLVQNSSDLIVVVDGAGTITEVTPVVERMLGRLPDAVIGMAISDLVHADDTAVVTGACRAARTAPSSTTLAWRAAHADGSWVPVESTCTDLLEDPAVRGVVLSVRDVRERKAFEEQLHHQAFHDALTGLPNRALFENRLEHAVARAVRTGERIGVLFVDLDDFKTINDSLGHAPGDELLTQTAARLDESLRGMDTAARLGGDEFAVLVEDIPGPEEVDAVAGRLHGALERPFMLGEHEVFVRASIGIAVSTGGDVPADELMRNADTAMYAAKAAGKGRHEVFRPTMHADATKRLQLTSDLRRAVQNDEFVVAYQPLVSLKDNRVLGAEALVRWEHPDFGRVPPIDFIPIAEETGLIIPIGEFVLFEACREATTWPTGPNGEPAPYVSVNLSPRQFLPHVKIVDVVKRACAETGLPPKRLLLEITESVVMQDQEAAARDLQALRDLGVRVAIDDFGTGYSSLSYLRDFPIDIVKMDQSFVKELGRGAADDALVRSVLELGEALDMDIVAEGIEDDSQLDSLRQLRCGIGQGYYFSQPLSAEEIGNVIRALPKAA